MGLIELAATDPTLFENLTVDQVVAMCGDGKLRDGSECSAQFRWFLAQIHPDKLAAYSRHCLDAKKDKFERSGFVLQDLVNEIGRRLGYVVTNGRYQGNTRDVGFDGVWCEGDTELVVEVKTTDAYRINLDTVLGYSAKIDAQSAERTSNSRFALVVVGRQDTGDLEAQVRGSRHAWSVRLVSVESLIKLMFVKEEVDDPVLTSKIRKVLLPFEYTRVDNIVDLVFETQQETETKSQVAEAEQSVDEERQPKGWEFTPAAVLDKKRFDAVSQFFLARRQSIERKSRAVFSSPDNSLRVVCIVSKRYRRDYQPYWYAFHPAWLELLREADDAYVALACMDRSEAFFVPFNIFIELLPKLGQTVKEERSYWHVALGEDDQGLFIRLPKGAEKFDLTPYRFALPA